MSGAFETAIADGVRRGIERVWTDRCDGRGDPEERCPMRTANGCACYYRAYMEAPFWRRWRMDKPHRPSQDDVLEAFVKQRVDEVLPEILAKATPEASAS